MQDFVCMHTCAYIHTHRNAHRHTETHTQTQIHPYTPSYLYSNSTGPEAGLIFLFRTLEGQSYLREKGNESHWGIKVHKCASSKWAIHLCDWKYNKHSLKRHLWWWLSKAKSPGLPRQPGAAALPLLVSQPAFPAFPSGLMLHWPTKAHCDYTDFHLLQPSPLSFSLSIFKILSSK